MAETASAYSATQTATLTYPDWWLEDPGNSANNIILSVVGGPHKRQKKEEQTVYQALERPGYIVVRGVMRKERFDLEIDFTTVAAWQAFENIRAQQRTLLLQRGYTGEQWFGSLGPMRDLEEHTSDYTYKKVKIEFIETDAP
jgi:hypothetical protein